MLLTRVAISPFDFGYRSKSEFLAHAEDLYGLQTREPPPWLPPFVCEELTFHPLSAAHELVLADDGFGLNIRREAVEVEHLADHLAIAQVLVARSAHHREMNAGRHPDALMLRSMRRTVTPPPNRLHVWAAPPYTLSFFHVAMTAEEKAATFGDPECRKGLSALLEPSRVRQLELIGSPTEAEACCRQVGCLDDDGLEGYHDADIKAGVTALSSWAGLVVLDEHASDLAYFEALELRLQSAWMRASFVRSWAEFELARPTAVPALMALAAQVGPLVRRSRRILDSEASSRDQHLFDELVKSSDLEREITAAEAAISDLEAAIEVQRSKARQRYNRTVELLLLVLAILQVVPLVAKTPLVTLTPVALTPLLLAVVALGWARWRTR